MPSYPIARYHFLFRVLTSIKLPDYAGSTLRGAFGRALRRTACMTRMRECHECPLRKTCPYTNLFEPCPPENHPLQKFSQIPVPYIIEPEGWGSRVYQPGETLNFAMVLIGTAIQQLPLVAYSWQRAFQHDVGHGTAELQDIQLEKGDERQSIYNAESQKILPHDATLLLEPITGNTARLLIYTPLRLQENGRALPPSEVTARRLLMALVRRISLLQEFYMGRNSTVDFSGLSAQAEQAISSLQLTWQNWTRYSSRQHQKMHLGGVIGEWQLDHLTPELLMYLNLGQWLHIGKNAAFGLGKYQLALPKKNPEGSDNTVEET